MQESSRGYSLGKWLERQQCLKWQCRLDPTHEDKLQRLVDAGQLTWTPQYIWDKMCALLLVWRDDPSAGRGQSCNVPVGELYEGWALGQWLQAQQEARWFHGLEASRVEKLQGLVDANQLTWDPDPVWQQVYAKMQQWALDPATGTGRNSKLSEIPRGEVYKGWLIGEWLHEQICGMWRRKLAQPHKRKLQVCVDAGKLSWEPQEVWDVLFSLLLEWHGDPAKGNMVHCNVPEGEVYLGWDLGRWLLLQQCGHWQKANHTSGTKRQEYLDALVSSGRLTWSPSAVFDELYSLLVQWRDDPMKGVGQHCDVPPEEVYKGWDLGRWLYEQQIAKWRRKLDAGQERKLQALHANKQLSWEPPEVWERMYEVLIEWRDDPEKGNGEHCSIHYTDTYKDWMVGHWLYLQQCKQAKGSLLPLRREKLQALASRPPS